MTIGTNFYARIIPTHERKKELKQLIDSSNDFNLILEEISNTYGIFDTYDDNVVIKGQIHLGKRSAGWKFLWNPNIYLIRNGHSNKIEIEPGHYKYEWIEEPNSAFYIYPLTKKGIKEFIAREDVEVYDEYGEIQDKDKFFEEAVNWNTWQGKEAFDSKTYVEYERSKNPYYEPYKCSGDYINLLEKEGYKFISEDKSDFYSDGLRFATNNEFS